MFNSGQANQRLEGRRIGSLEFLDQQNRGVYSGCFRYCGRLLHFLHQPADFEIRNRKSYLYFLPKRQCLFR